MDAIDFSSPMTWVFIALALFEFAHLAFTGTLALGLVIVLIKKGKADVHDWAAALSKWLDSLGFSAIVTAPLDKIAAGNVAGALGAGASLMTHVLNPANAATEFSNVLPKLWSDKTIGPMVQKTVADLQAGASQATLQADLTPLITAGRGAIPRAPVVTQVHDALAHIQSAVTSNIGLSDRLAGINANLSAMGLGHLFPLVAAGAAAATPAGPVLVPAIGAAEVLKVATDAAKSAVASALPGLPALNTLTIPDKHEAVIRPITAPAATAA